VIPGGLSIRRAEPGKETLVVHLRIDGTATPDQDYVRLPWRVEIPAGETSADLIVAPLDDLLAEGPEVVRVRIVSSPSGTVTPYQVGLGAGQAMVVIGDDEPDAPEARLDILAPVDGATVPPNSTLTLTAVGVWTHGEVDRPVGFYDGDVLIGRSEPTPYLRPPIPNWPVLHTVQWVNPAPGEHVLTARTELSWNLWLESPPVRIQVGDEPPLTRVRIEATQRIAEESSYPYRRMAFVGVFQISRSGPTDHSLPVFLQYSGTATPDDFAEPLPWLVSIPAGASSVEVRVVPLPDDKPEGIETLVAALSNCPPDTDPPMGMPCYGFAIDPAAASATVFLRDDGVTQSSIVITRPQEGDTFQLGEAIGIEAVAIDLNSYINRVEFWDGGRRIGVSEIVFIRAPDPGTPIYHSFEWSDAAVGPHRLTARAVNHTGTLVISLPVTISVAGLDQVPVVRVVPRDVFAVEPQPDRPPNPAVFEIRRQGPTNENLTVYYTLGGVAENGLDYEMLEARVVIQAGRRAARVVVRPLPDDMDECLETVSLRLVEPPYMGPMAAYYIGFPGRAVVVISDQPWAWLPGRARCRPLRDGWIHVCFEAETGRQFRIEVSADFRHWDTVFQGTGKDGAIHFVDDQVDLVRHRFYRLIAEPDGTTEP
jgi:hypothetical protein